MKTPESIKKHSADYKDHSWEDYNPMELGCWVHLLVKRACHRANKYKAKKDLDDAQNYLNMLQQHINEAKIRLEV